MLKRFLLALVILPATALPSDASPVCYMEMHGQITDLSHLCGDGGQPAGTLAVVAPSSSSALFTDVWTRNYHFSNERWDSSTNRFGPSSSITGNIHNSSDIAAENVVVEAIGYAEGRSPQTRRQTIASINANDATLVTFDFDFSVSVTGWDVRVVEWE